jgi:polyadenylation factor subunit 2
MQCDLVGYLQVWDFKSLKPESTLTGHGGDVKACDWHPSKGAIASGSKDATVKLWDPRAGDACLSTLELHKAPISQVSWNQNGNWLLSASRDQQLVVRSLFRLFAIYKAVTSASLSETQKSLRMGHGFDSENMPDMFHGETGSDH